MNVRLLPGRVTVLDRSVFRMREKLGHMLLADALMCGGSGPDELLSSSIVPELVLSLTSCSFRMATNTCRAVHVYA